MKFIFLFILAASFSAWSKDGVKDFNKVLLEDVKKDLNTENDDQFRVKKPVSRGPASVAPVSPAPEKKIDKNLKQLGSEKW